MLRRKVERVAVFINTDTKIETDTSVIKTRFCGMDTTLMSFFGYSLYHSTPNYSLVTPGTRLTDTNNDSFLYFLRSGILNSENQVFFQHEFDALSKVLREKVSQGQPAVCTQTLKVLDNPRWGINGGWYAKIMWVYLSPDIGMSWRWCRILI